MKYSDAKGPCDYSSLGSLNKLQFINRFFKIIDYK